VGRGFSRDNLASRKLGFSPRAALVLNSILIDKMTAHFRSAYIADSIIIFLICGHQK
jgi:hypothetical protein